MYVIKSKNAISENFNVLWNYVTVVATVVATVVVVVVATVVFHILLKNAKLENT